MKYNFETKTLTKKAKQNKLWAHPIISILSFILCWKDNPRWSPLWSTWFSAFWAEKLEAFVKSNQINLRWSLLWATWLSSWLHTLHFPLSASTDIRCQVFIQETPSQPNVCQGWLMVLMASDVGLFLGARTSSRFLSSCSRGDPGKVITVTYPDCCCFPGWSPTPFTSSSPASLHPLSLPVLSPLSSTSGILSGFSTSCYCCQAYHFQELWLVRRE